MDNRVRDGRVLKVDAAGIKGEEENGISFCFPSLQPGLTSSAATCSTNNLLQSLKKLRIFLPPERSQDMMFKASTIVHFL